MSRVLFTQDMEDSSVMDLMDANEYLIDEWDFDYSICEDDYEIKPNQINIMSDHKEIEEKRQGFELVPEKPKKQKKTKNNTSSPSSSSSSSTSSSLSSQFISFGDCNIASPVVDGMNISEIMDMEQFRQDVSLKKSNGRRQPHLLKEHVIAERKRRQRLNERLIALSALIPDLKKADKATVLEDAIKHLKQLQERVKQLEEERDSTIKTMKSVILVEKNHISMDENSCSDGQIHKETLPLIEARVSNNDILIKIHCEKSKGCFGKILCALQNFDLDFVNTFSLPFGKSTLDITILAKMNNNNFTCSVKDVVKSIRSAIVE